jgi:hypothetical protein
MPEDYSQVDTALSPRLHISDTPPHTYDTQNDVKH